MILKKCKLSYWDILIDKNSYFWKNYHYKCLLMNNAFVICWAIFFPFNMALSLTMSVKDFIYLNHFFHPFSHEVRTKWCCLSEQCCVEELFKCCHPAHLEMNLCSSPNSYSHFIQINWTGFLRRKLFWQACFHFMSHFH